MDLQFVDSHWPIIEMSQENNIGAGAIENRVQSSTNGCIFAALNQSQGFQSSIQL